MSRLLDKRESSRRRLRELHVRHDYLRRRIVTRYGAEMGIIMDSELSLEVWKSMYSDTAMCHALRVLEGQIAGMNAEIQSIHPEMVKLFGDEGYVMVCLQWPLITAATKLDNPSPIAESMTYRMLIPEPIVFSAMDMEEFPPDLKFKEVEIQINRYKIEGREFRMGYQEDLDTLFVNEIRG